MLELFLIGSIKYQPPDMSCHQWKEVIETVANDDILSSKKKRILLERIHVPIQCYIGT